MNAVDTNVYVYALDADEPTKQSQAIALLDQLALHNSDTVLLWQVAGEFLQCLRKWESSGRISTADVKENFEDVAAMFPLRVPTSASLAISFELRSRYSLSHWGSMLLAACREAGVDLLYSEDMGHETTYDGVKIVNPFV